MSFLCKKIHKIVIQKVQHAKQRKKKYQLSQKTAFQARLILKTYLVDTISIASSTGGSSSFFIKDMFSILGANFVKS